MHFFKKKSHANYAPLEPGEEAQPLAMDVPRPLTVDGESYTVLDSVIYREQLYLICVGGSAGGNITVFETTGDDAYCTPTNQATSAAVYSFYIRQPK